MRDQREWQRVLDVIPDAIAILDREHRIQWVNKVMAGLLGPKADELIGRPSSEIVHDLSSPAAFCPHSQSLHNGHVHAAEVYEPNLGGYFLVSLSPFCDDNGRVAGGILVARDISSQKEAEEALRLAGKQLERHVAQGSKEMTEKDKHLEELNAALKVLLRQWEGERAEMEESVIHNINTMVLPYLERLERGSPSVEQTDWIEVIKHNLQRIVSPFVRSMSDKVLGLSPAEIRVAEMVRAGKSNKEIGDTLYVSEGTVRSHRERLRKKLGLTNQKINLRAYLQSLQ